MAEAVELVAEEMGGNGQGVARGEPGNGSGNPAVNLGEIEHLREENKRLWDQVERLTAMLEEAQQRALPSPHRPWWAFWRR